MCAYAGLRLSACACLCVVRIVHLLHPCCLRIESAAQQNRRQCEASLASSIAVRLCIGVCLWACMGVQYHEFECICAYRHNSCTHVNFCPRAGMCVRGCLCMQVPAVYVRVCSVLASDKSLTHLFQARCVHGGSLRSCGEALASRHPCRHTAYIHTKQLKKRRSWIGYHRSQFTRRSATNASTPENQYYLT